VIRASPAAARSLAPPPVEPRKDKMSRDYWVSAIEWIVIAGIVAIDVGMAHATGIGVDANGAWTYGETVALLILIWPATLLLTHVTGFAKDAAFLSEIPGKFFAYIAVASVLEYYLATSPAPLNDGLLIDSDHALGFDWPAACRWLAAHPAVHPFLAYPYFSLATECGVVVAVIGIFYPRRARRFVTALILSSILTIPLLWFFPVGGPFATFHDIGLPRSCFSYAYIGTRDYLAMRTHAYPAIPVAKMTGIVAFPSYHATCAVLLTYFLRGVPVLFPIAVAFNLMMLLATPFIGGHYLTDVVAGLAVAAATIYGIERIEAGFPAERVPLWRAAPKPEEA
jgi:membrane-associated phospholipid phosphatase